VALPFTVTPDAAAGEHALQVVAKLKFNGQELTLKRNVNLLVETAASL
jgi:hypothetical protein